MAAGFYHWLEAGKQFKAIKDDLGPRQWAPWLRDHGFARYTPDVLIKIAEKFDPVCAVTAQIEPLELNFEALRALASRSVPVAAAQAAGPRRCRRAHHPLRAIPSS